MPQMGYPATPINLAAMTPAEINSAQAAALNPSTGMPNGQDPRSSLYSYLPSQVAYTQALREMMFRETLYQQQMAMMGGMGNFNNIMPQNLPPGLPNNAQGGGIANPNARPYPMNGQYDQQTEQSMNVAALLNGMRGTPMASFSRPSVNGQPMQQYVPPVDKQSYIAGPRIATKVTKTTKSRRSEPKYPRKFRKCWLCVVYGKNDEDKARIQMKWDDPSGKMIWSDGHGDSYCPSLDGRATPMQVADAKRAWSKARSKKSPYRKFLSTP